MKKSKFFYALSASVLAAAFVFCAACTPPTEEPDVLSRSYEGTVSGITFRLPDLGEAVELHTEAQRAFLQAEDYAAAIFNYAKGVEELSAPLPVTFTWEAEGAAEDALYTLRVSENKDMSNAWTFFSQEPAQEVYNLKIGTTYWWTVTVGKAVSGKAAFTTEDAGPRNLFVDGVANVRDVGGYVLTGGGRIKQGVLFRTGRLNENKTGETTITAQGMETVLERLHVKTEIDLRGGTDEPDEYAPSVNKSVLDGVLYFHIGMNWNGDLWTLNPNEIRAVFALLAEENNYPMFYHCSIGTDRTGIITYLLLGLLGVDEDAIYRDYLFSNFANIGAKRELTNVTSKYGATIAKNYPGESLQEKCRAALLDIGVSEAELDRIADILTE